jgi:hypothetical protein
VNPSIRLGWDGCRLACHHTQPSNFLSENLMVGPTRSVRIGAKKTSRREARGAEGKGMERSLSESRASPDPDRGSSTTGACPLSSPTDRVSFGEIAGAKQRQC